MASKRKAEVQFVRGAQGRDEVLIRVPCHKLYANAAATKYHIISVQEPLDVEFDCEGTHCKATLIVKIFCKIPAVKVRAHLLARARRRISEGKPVVIDLH